MKSTSSPLRRGPAAPTISCAAVASYEAREESRDDQVDQEEGQEIVISQKTPHSERTLH